MSSNAKHFFVTGSSGFLGIALLRALLESDSELRFTLLEHHSKIVVEEKYRDRVTIVTGSFEEVRTLQDIDGVIHLAAITHTTNEELYHAVNKEGTEKLLKLSKEVGVKHFIYISTTALGNSCGAYGASKLGGEEAVRRSGMPYTIIRLAEVYGALTKEDSEGIGRLINAVKRFPVMPYVTNTFFAPVYVDDAITALRAAMRCSPENKTYIIAGPEKISFSEALREIAPVLHKKIVCVPMPRALLHLFKRATPFLFAPDQVDRLICEKNYDNSLAIQDLKFRPRSFREGLKNFVRRP